MDEPKIIPVADVFSDISYVVPIYQRNYAWSEQQIVQLIEDIDGAIKTESAENVDYFLGSLIVNQTDKSVFEVIDGQQRLTTLFLLGKVLKLSIANSALRFEARENSNRTLRDISSDINNLLDDELICAEIVDGYKIIDDYFKRKEIGFAETFKMKLSNVFLVHVQVPKKIDLNHYFEIMNTRGEQLEIHEIAKAKILKELSGMDRKIAAEIWDKCSDMSSYVQMNFKIGIRRSVFADDWSSLRGNINSFDDVVKVGFASEKSAEDRIGEDRAMRDILADAKVGKPIGQINVEEREDNERFESIISFPNFLLQVNAVLASNGEDESNLDDKQFLNNMEWAWKDETSAKSFLFELLRLRVLFDKYVIKREYARDYKETGKWSLQKLKKYIDKSQEKPQYVGAYGESDDDDASDNKQLRTLQSCLRITYTSPKTMYWITLVLAELRQSEGVNLLALLESYCNEKVSESGFEKFNTAHGYGFERIVFTYLDYLLYRDGYEGIDADTRNNFQFQFRTSIEHFYPQKPEGDAEGWSAEALNSFGNLVLLTVSGNSRFSNLAPKAKVGMNAYANIEKQSLKLKVMKALLDKNNEDGWNPALADKHKTEMFMLLNDALAKEGNSMPPK